MHCRHKASICLVEHNPLAAERLRQVLAEEPSIRVFSPEEVLGNHYPPKRKDVSVFVIDRGALPESLSKYLRFLRFHLPEVKPIVLDSSRPHDELLTLLVLGVHGFVSYNEAGESLSAAIQSVAEGHLWFAPHVLEQYVQFSARVSQAKVGAAGLTPCEQRIIALLNRRLANKEIATVLGVSENTVKFHLSNIYAKLGVNDRQSAVETANSRKLIEISEPLAEET